MQYILTQEEMDGLVPRKAHEDLLTVYERKDNCLEELREALLVLPAEQKKLVESRFIELGKKRLATGIAMNRRLANLALAGMEGGHVFCDVRRGPLHLCIYCQTPLLDVIGSRCSRNGAPPVGADVRPLQGMDWIKEVLGDCDE